jgi:ParB family chromosome partitioning protein
MRAAPRAASIPTALSKKPKGLGLGLEALLGPTVGVGSDPAAAPVELPLDALAPGRYQPRSRIDEASLATLADSIRAQGVMQPVVVRPRGAGAGGAAWEIVAGERRWRAARLAGLDRVPVFVRDVGDDAAAVMALVENIQREDLNPLEEAQGLSRLVAEFGLTHEQAAAAVGRSRSAASNLLRLLQLAAPVQQMLLDGRLEMGHARALLPLPAAEQVLAATEVIARSMSVRDAERLVVRRVAAGGGAAGGGAGGAVSAPRAAGAGAAGPSRAADHRRLEDRLADHLAAPVEVRIAARGQLKGAGGEVVVRFGSFAELDALLERMGLRAE